MDSYFPSANLAGILSWYFLLKKKKQKTLCSPSLYLSLNTFWIFDQNKWVCGVIREYEFRPHPVIN